MAWFTAADMPFLCRIEERTESPFLHVLLLHNRANVESRDVAKLALHLDISVAHVRPAGIE